MSAVIFSTREANIADDTDQPAARYEGTKTMLPNFIKLS